jgi:sphingomyelin phosphodiesterase
MALGLVVGLLCLEADAKTHVYVQNNTSLSFAVSSAQTGPRLGRDEWRQSTDRVDPFERVKVVWFNRDEGITNGEEFHFITRLQSTRPAATLVLKQALQGRLINSHLWQALQVPAQHGQPGVKHEWRDGRRTRTATLRLPGRELHIKYRAYFTGTDDDIEYILREAYRVPPPITERPALTLNLLFWNIYMRPTNMFANGQGIRARLIPPQVRGYDAIVFCEAFDDDARSDLLRGLRTEYPHRSRILGSDRGLEQDGGVIVVSRWPIEEQDQRLFGDTSTGSDALADKGVLYVRINKNGMRYHIFGTHLQNADRPMRARQLRIVKDFIDARDIPANQPVIIAGDMNVNRYSRSGEYGEMLRALDAVHPPLQGHPYSHDGPTNDLYDGGRTLLDYVLYSRSHRRPLGAYNEVRVIRSPREWKEIFWETAYWDLSDHYAVFGRVEFTPWARAAGGIASPAAAETKQPRLPPVKPSPGRGKLPPPRTASGRKLPLPPRPTRIATPAAEVQEPTKGKALDIKVGLRPRTVLAGGKTIITVHAYAGKQGRLPGARITLQASGGSFGTGKQAVRTVRGTTNQAGVFRAVWHTGAARLYKSDTGCKFAITASKKGYKTATQQVGVTVKARGSKRPSPNWTPSPLPKPRR